MISVELFAEPGFWAAALLLLVGAEKALGGALSRSRFWQLNEVTDQILSSSKYVSAPDAEKAQTRTELARHLVSATAWYTPLILVWVAPWVAITRLWHAIVAGKSPPSLVSADPLRDLAFSAALRRSPVILVWVYFWIYLCVYLGRPFKRMDRERMTAPLFEAARRVEWRNSHS
jgi:hypothetical protein